jgi:hypothetical protein
VSAGASAELLVALQSDQVSIGDEALPGHPAPLPFLNPDILCIRPVVRRTCSHP